MANYPYTIFSCGCNPKCVCNLCGIKASICKYANCKNCNKIEGHKGCQYK